jgi:GGDEF domain-containing protein
MKLTKTRVPIRRDTVDPVGIDEGTGVWNRGGFIAAASPMLASCVRRNASAALACFDVDTSGTGRSQADNLLLTGALIALADQLRKAYRSSDVIGRVGTYRLVVLLTDYVEVPVGIVEGVRALSDTSAPSALTLATVLVHAGPEATVDQLLREAASRMRHIRGFHPDR